MTRTVTLHDLTIGQELIVYTPRELIQAAGPFADIEFEGVHYPAQRPVYILVHGAFENESPVTTEVMDAAAFEAQYTGAGTAPTPLVRVDSRYGRFLVPPNQTVPRAINNS